MGPVLNYFVFFKVIFFCCISPFQTCLPKALVAERDESCDVPCLPDRGAPLYFVFCIFFSSKSSLFCCISPFQTCILVAERDESCDVPCDVWQRGSPAKIGETHLAPGHPCISCISPVFVTVFVSFDLRLHLSCCTNSSWKLQHLNVISYTDAGGGFTFIVIEPRHFIYQYQYPTALMKPTGNSWAFR